jgi:GT2 family glycosyltransferase
MLHPAQGAVRVTIVVVSFNTRDILHRCLSRLALQAAALPTQVIVVDNASTDGAAQMVATCFPQFHLQYSGTNLGFAAANKRAFQFSTGEFLVLFNPDAFLGPDALATALAHMAATSAAGLGGARLQDEHGIGQPSGRLFPSRLNELLALSGLAARHPGSRLFGRFDRTWADPKRAARVDRVPGAFTIIRRSARQSVGVFDERFFLYYEEVDLCRRIARAGLEVWYWPDIVVTHLGGASSKTLTTHDFAESGSQLTLWRMRSALLYYRKHHGRCVAWLLAQMEIGWNRLRLMRHAQAGHGERMAGLARTVQLMRQAWRDTEGGAVSPRRPW